MAKFNKLDVPHQWKDEFTKYPHGYTIFEALCNWTKQVDNMVDNVNDWNDYLDNFVDNFEFELQGEVQSTIEKWQSEGLLDGIIESALNTELDNVKTQLAQSMVNVKHPPYPLDAVVGGGVDDSINAQAIINYVKNNGGGIVFFPSGDYSLNIYIPTGVIVRGVSTANILHNDAGGTVFRPFDYSKPCVMVGNGEELTRGGSLENVKIIGTSQSVKGLQIGGAQHITIKDVAIRDFDDNITIENLPSLNTYYIQLINVKSFHGRKSCIKTMWHPNISSFTTSVFGVDILLESLPTIRRPNNKGGVIHIDGVNVSFSGRADCGNWSDSDYDSPVYIKRTEVSDGITSGLLSSNGDFFIDGNSNMVTVELDGNEEDDLTKFFSGNVRIDGGVLLPNNKIERSPNLNLLNVMGLIPPKTKNSIGRKGDMVVGDKYVYICYLQNNWIRLPRDDRFEATVNEINYNPTDWSEWTTSPSGVEKSSSGLKLIANGVDSRYARIKTNIKPSAEYIVLVNVVDNTLTNPLRQGNELTGEYIQTIPPGYVGMFKYKFTTMSNIKNNVFSMSTFSTEDSGNNIQVKDIRIFELVKGEQMQFDYDNLTAQQLSNKYPF